MEEDVAAIAVGTSETGSDDDDDLLIVIINSYGELSRR